MFPVFLALAIAGLLALVGGSAWILVTQGQTRRRTGPEAGAEVMGQVLDDGAEGLQVELGSAFKGTGVSVERNVDVALSDVKQALRVGQWRAALPVLVAWGGMLVLLLFGGLALWSRMEDQLLGLVLLAVSIYAVGRLIYDLARA